MTNIFDKYLPSTLGFDHVFDMLDRASDLANNSNAAFPPINVVRVDENNYLVEIAVAGYSENEIDISVEKNQLVVIGKKEVKDERKYVVKGIAGRSFTRTFLLSDTMIVNDADLKDGILSIKMENVVPEAHKPRKIPVNKLVPQVLTE